MAFWYKELEPVEKRTFWACFTGWGLDALDTQMYALTLSTLMALWGMTKGEAGILGTTVLIMASLGGWIAGILADKYGRVKVMQITIIWFSLFTFLSGFANDFWQLLITRSLQGIGFGGEWAVGAVLISETIKPRLRGRVVGAIQAGWAVGYAIAVLLSTVIFTLLPKEYGWRVFFCMGLLPALIVLWMRRNIHDSPIFKEQQVLNANNKKTFSSIWRFFAPPYTKITLLAVLLTTGIYGGNYIMITWLPAYLKLVLNLSITNIGGYLAINILGSFTGAFLNGWLADSIGRRKTFMLVAFCQAITVAIYTMVPLNMTITLFMGFLLGTLQSGTAAGTGAFLAELFPTEIRAGAQGFCGNAGRAIGAVLPTVVGLMADSFSLGLAMGICACFAYGLVVVAAFFLPETRGQNLETMQIDISH